MLNLQKKQKADVIFHVSSNFLFQYLRFCERKKCQTVEHNQFITVYLKSMMVQRRTKERMNKKNRSWCYIACSHSQKCKHLLKKLLIDQEFKYNQWNITHKQKIVELYLGTTARLAFYRLFIIEKQY